MDTIPNLNKFQSCTNGVPVRNLKLAKSQLIELKFIKGEVWHLDLQQWVEAAWSLKGKVMGVHNGMHFDCSAKGYSLSELAPSIKAEVISKFKPLGSLVENKPSDTPFKKTTTQLKLF